MGLLRLAMLASLLLYLLLPLALTQPVHQEGEYPFGFWYDGEETGGQLYVRNGRQPRAFSHHQGLGSELDLRDTRDHQRMLNDLNNKNLLLALRSRWQRAMGSRLKRDPDGGMYGFIKKTVVPFPRLG